MITNRSNYHNIKDSTPGFKSVSKGLDDRLKKLAKPLVNVWPNTQTADLIKHINQEEAVSRLRDEIRFTSVIKHISLGVDCHTVRPFWIGCL